MKPICVFEGPPFKRYMVVRPGVTREILKGWVNIMHFDPATGVKSAGLSSSAAASRRSAEKNGWRFFARGTWEDSSKPVPEGKTFPAIKPEIWREINARGEALAL